MPEKPKRPGQPGGQPQQPPEGFMQLPKEPITRLDIGVGVPTDLLEQALKLDVGVGVGRMAIASKEIAQQLSELTEDPRFKELSTLPMFVSRDEEDKWEIRVGKRKYSADKKTLERIISGKISPEGAKEQGPSQN